MGAAATDLDFEPFHEKLTTASGISLREQVKWADFRDDARRQGPDLARCPGWPFPGEVFVWFKALMLLRRPRRCAGPSPGGRPAPGPSQLRGRPPALRCARELLRQPVSRLRRDQRSPRRPRRAPRARAVCVSSDAQRGASDVLLHVLELFCIVLIVRIYWSGRSPGPHGGAQIPRRPRPRPEIGDGTSAGSSTAGWPSASATPSCCIRSRPRS